MSMFSSFAQTLTRRRQGAVSEVIRRRWSMRHVTRANRAYGSHDDQWVPRAAAAAAAAIVLGVSMTDGRIRADVDHNARSSSTLCQFEMIQRQERTVAEYATTNPATTPKRTPIEEICKESFQVKQV